MLVMADPVFEMADARLKDKPTEVAVAQREEGLQEARLMAAIEEDSGGYFTF